MWQDLDGTVFSGRWSQHAHVAQIPIDDPCVFPSKEIVTGRSGAILHVVPREKPFNRPFSGQFVSSVLESLIRKIERRRKSRLSERGRGRRRSGGDTAEQALPRDNPPQSTRYTVLIGGYVRLVMACLGSEDRRLKTVAAR